jgi:nicotinate-nucleotide adenylyltransferase
MKIGIFGGTFNPAHTGHIKAARTAVESLALDKLLIVPTAQPPHKNLPENSPTAAERLEMARLAFADVPRAEVCDLELRRGGKSYTVDTLRELRRLYPDGEFFLMMGTDMFLNFTAWYKVEEILREARLAVLDREDASREIREYAEMLRRDWGARVDIVPIEPVVVSSTELRALLQSASGAEYLAPAVYAYIVKNRFFGVKPELAWLRERARELLDPKRVPHVEGCEQEAVRLAERWGEDTYSAAAAGILHDITKKCSENEQLILCEKYGTLIDTFERESPKLLHAKTGADMAYAEFGISEKVRDAIRWHTTGRDNMTLLEKIIYMADYTEPNRSFDGVDELRRLAYENLDAAVVLGLKMSIEDVSSRGSKPHPMSQTALDYLLRDK